MASQEVEGDVHVKGTLYKQMTNVLPPNNDCPAITTIGTARDDQAGTQKPRMQALWEQASCRELSVPYKYRNVAVLVIRWANYLDDELHCEEEVHELCDLFSEGYSFYCRVEVLDDKRKPQVQLRRAIDDLILSHDGPCRSNLLIVYYTGHGVAKEGEGLFITGKNKDPDAPRIHPYHRPIANWNEAEVGLNDADADVLTILDTCYAGSIWKGSLEEARSFEVLAASARDDMTAAPEPKSFTRALIDVLRDRLTKPEPFTAVELHAEIMRRRKDERSTFSFRHDQDKHRFIKLAPLNPKSQHTSLVADPRAIMTLIVSLGDTSSLKPEQIETLARLVSQGAVEANVGVQRIDLVDYQETNTPVRKADLRQLIRAVKNAQRLWRGHDTRRRLKREREDGTEVDLRSTKRPDTVHLSVRPEGEGGYKPPSPSPSMRSHSHSPKPSTSP